jgi:hypothetical protein
MLIIIKLQRKDSLGLMWFLSHFYPVVSYLILISLAKYTVECYDSFKDVCISAENPLKVLCYLSIFLYACYNLRTAEHVFMI